MLTAPTSAANPPSSPHPRRAPDWVTVAAALAVALGVVLRLWPRPALWLDEAQSIAIAQVPLRDLPSLLKTDGAPPLYYAVLHVWMAVFGQGDWVVRLPSVLASLATIAVIAVAARRWGGRAAVLPAVVLVATNPFAIRYATETRMYALIALEVAIGLVVLHRALERPTAGRWVPVALVVAALMYTHYWSIYLLGGVGLVLVVHAWRRRRTPAGRASLQGGGVRRRGPGAVAAVGGHLPLPGPAHGHAVDEPPKPWDVLEVVPALSAGSGRGGGVVAFLLTVLVLLALFGRAVDRRHTELDWRTRPPARGLAAVLVLVPALAVLGGYLSGSAFVTRYLSVIFPVLIVLTAMGLVTVGGARAQAVILILASVVSLGVASAEVPSERTPGAPAGPGARSPGPTRRCRRLLPRPAGPRPDARAAGHTGGRPRAGHLPAVAGTGPGRLDRLRAPPPGVAALRLRRRGGAAGRGRARCGWCGARPTRRRRWRAPACATCWSACAPVSRRWWWTSPASTSTTPASTATPPPTSVVR